MYNLWPIILIIFSIVGLVIIFSRHLPRLRKEEPAQETQSNGIAQAVNGKINQVLNQERKHKIKFTFFSLLEKFVHRLRVIILRLDNFLGRWLHNIRITKKPAQHLENESDILKQNLSQETPGSEIPTHLDVGTDFELEEKRFLNIINQNRKDLEAIKNLTRLYLQQMDLSSARMILINGYHVNPDDSIIESLFLDIWDKEEKLPA